MNNTDEREWDDWIGREVKQTEWLDEALAARWCATFDRALPDGAVMPQGIHFCLGTPDAPTASLGDDGHPKRSTSPDSFLPPIPLPRRMWAGSVIQFRSPILTGKRITRYSTVGSITEKKGKSGRLVFVLVDHGIWCDGVKSINETQTLVFRDAAAPDAPLAPPEPGGDVFDPSDWEAHHVVRPDPRLLFRYSALTFNTHRIHYDAPYARDVERYRGLVVHGPLTASLLLQLAASELGDNAIAYFHFRGLSPAIAGEELHCVMRKSEKGYEMGAFAADGRQVMEAGVILQTDQDHTPVVSVTRHSS